MKTSFTAHATEETAPPLNAALPIVGENGVTPGATALAVQPPRTMSLFGGGQVEGQVDRSDIKLPRVNLVQKAGKLGDDFKAGAVVLAREVLLSDGSSPVNVIILSIRKQYQESLPYDEAGPTPKLLDTAEQVLEAGGSLQFGDDNLYKEMATALCLVEAPAGANQDVLDSYFFYEADGKAYCMALWTFAGSAYNHAAKKLITAGTYGHLKDGYTKGNWAFTTEKRVWNGNTFYVPNPKPAGRTTPEFQEWAHALVNR